MIDTDALVEVAASPIDDYIRETVQKRVVQYHCEGGIFCGQMCDVVRHEVEMLRLQAWKFYARLN